MDAINQDVLKQLQEYARRYFAAIVELNTVNGKCNLAPGKYSAKQLIDNSHKSVFGHCFALPEDEVYNENIAVQSGTFRASFPYRRIFAILADWEAMSKAGKLKTVFEIEGAEEKSAKVMTSEKTILGAYKEKKMTLRRIHGNWWGEVKEIRKNKGYSGYYELNGVMFQGGGKTFFGEPEHESTVNFCEKHGDDEMKTAILNYIVQNPGSEFCAYYSEVLSRAGISMDNQEATAIMEAAREEKRKRDEEEARELAERKAREEEARRKRQEMETRVKRQMAEKLAKAKEDFVSGNKISEEDFEDIAASIGYEINIRTVGTLRKRVEWIEVDSEGTPTVYGTKRRAGLDGTFEAIREVYARLKESAAQAKEGNESIKHISEIMETCRTWDDEKRDYTDEYKYYTWLANHIPEHENTNKNVTEIVLEEVRERIATAATLVAHGVPKCDIEGAVCAVVKRLAKMDDILRFYDAIEPPQPPTTSTDIQTIKPQEKRAQTARKESKRTIQISLIVQRPQSVVRNLRTSQSYHFADVRKMVVPRLVKNVPRGCFTEWSPPIRGDCVIV